MLGMYERPLPLTRQPPGTSRPPEPWSPSAEQQAAFVERFTTEESVFTDEGIRLKNAYEQGMVRDAEGLERHGAEGPDAWRVRMEQGEPPGETRLTQQHLQPEARGVPIAFDTETGAPSDRLAGADLSTYEARGRRGDSDGKAEIVDDSAPLERPVSALGLRLGMGRPHGVTTVGDVLLAKHEGSIRAVPQGVCSTELGGRQTLVSALQTDSVRRQDAYRPDERSGQVGRVGPAVG